AADRPGRRCPAGPPRAGRAAGDRALDYRWEWRGRNLIQTRMAMATSSHGESRKCTVKLMTVRATMARRARTMIAVMGSGLLFFGRDVLRLPPASVPVDRDQPRFAPWCAPTRASGSTLTSVRDLASLMCWPPTTATASDIGGVSGRTGY